MTKNQRTKKFSFLNQNITHEAVIVDFEMTKGHQWSNRLWDDWKLKEPLWTSLFTHGEVE